MTRREEILNKAISVTKSNMQLYGIRSTDECCVAACQEIAEWADSTMVEKVVEWLALNAELYGGFNGGKLNEMVCKLKKEIIK